jgi:hypothetical protein
MDVTMDPEPLGRSRGGEARLKYAERLGNHMLVSWLRLRCPHRCAGLKRRERATASRVGGNVVRRRYVQGRQESAEHSGFS